MMPLMSAMEASAMRVSRRGVVSVLATEPSSASYMTSTGSTLKGTSQYSENMVTICGGREARYRHGTDRPTDTQTVRKVRQWSSQ